jgi:hypothetical protein
VPWIVWITLANEEIGKAFRDKNRKVAEDYMTAVIEGIQIFRASREKAYKAIFELTWQKDPVLLERLTPPI